MADELAEELARSAMEMGAHSSVEATLESICSHVVTELDADACGVFLLRGRRVEVAAVSGLDAAEAERVQLETGEGPCLETVWTSDSVVVPDLRTDGRWPRWAARMVEVGWRSALSLQLVEDQRTVGSLNLFSRTTDAFTRESAEVGLLFAQHASLALAASRTESSLHEAVGARHRIGMAQGILMHRYGLGAEEAFVLLRRYSQHTNTKLHQVAAQVVEARGLPSQPSS